MSSTTDKVLTAASLFTGAALATSLFNYFKSNENSVVEPSVQKPLTDPANGESRFITRIEATQRAKVISNLKYKVVLATLKGGQDFHG